MSNPQTTTDTIGRYFLLIFGTLCVVADLWVWFGMDATHNQRGEALGAGLAGLVMWWMAGRMKKGLQL